MYCISLNLTNTRDTGPALPYYPYICQGDYFINDIKNINESIIVFHAQTKIILKTNSVGDHVFIRFLCNSKWTQFYDSSISHIEIPYRTKGVQYFVINHFNMIDSCINKSEYMLLLLTKNIFYFNKLPNDIKNNIIDNYIEVLNEIKFKDSRCIINSVFIASSLTEPVYIKLLSTLNNLIIN